MLWEIAVNSTLNGQKCANVFYYCSRTIANLVVDPSLADPGCKAAQMLTAFNTTVFTPLRGAQAGDVKYTNIVARNLLDPLDAGILDKSGILGTSTPAATSTLPTQDAIAFKLEGAGNAGRPGQKRLAGISAAMIADGVLTDAAMITQLTATAAAFVASLVPTASGIDYVPVIVKRIADVSADGHFYRRLPQTILECILRQIVACTYSTFISTQNSRKVGRGS